MRGQASEALPRLDGKPVTRGPSNDPFLDQLEALVEGGVHIGPWTSDGGKLREKLDALERAVELLRLKTGHVSNGLPMHDFLGRGLAVSRGAAGSPMLHVTDDGDNPFSTACRPDGFKQSELQAPLIIFLLRQDLDRTPIRTTISGFVEDIQPYLSPADVETTKTG